MGGKIKMIKFISKRQSNETIVYESEHLHKGLILAEGVILIFDGKEYEITRIKQDLSTREYAHSISLDINDTIIYLSESGKY